MRFWQSQLVRGLSLMQCLLWLVGVAYAQTPNKVVLLTSIDTSSIKAPFWKKKYYRTYHLKLEKLFREKFGKAATVEVTHFANQSDLWRTLHDPAVLGAFWVSHAGGSAENGIIIDSAGFDVLPVLGEAHPHLRFLGIVGCKAKPLLKAFEAELARSNPDLLLYSFDKKVDAKAGLKKAIKAFRAQMQKPVVAPPVCRVREGYPVRVLRTLADPRSPAKYAAVRIENRGQVLAVLPPGQAGDEQEVLIHIPPFSSVPSALELKVSVSAGANPWVTAEQVGIGALDVRGSWNGAEWRVFANPQGLPIGVVTHIYRYVSALFPSVEPESYLPFDCSL